jgi:sec-independent protein translocase protein TatA
MSESFGPMVSLFGFLDFLGPSELVLVAIVAVLLYGERLPEVARNFGKNFVEFKKSIQGIREEFEAAAHDVGTKMTASEPSKQAADAEEATAPKFEPPPADITSESH